jgi:hypothetical protein
MTVVSFASASSSAHGRTSTSGRTASSGTAEATAESLRAYRLFLQEALAELATASAPASAGAPVAPVGQGVPPPDGLLGELCRDRVEAALVAAAWWSVADPGLASAFGHLHDDDGRRYPSLAVLRLLLRRHGLDVPLALPTDDGLVAAGVLRPVGDAETPVRLTRTATLVLAGHRPQRLQTDAVAIRLRDAVAHTTALVAAGHRVCLRCGDAEDGAVVAAAAAAALDRHLDVLDAPDRDDATARPVAETELLVRLGQVLPVCEGEHPAARLRLVLAGAAVPPGWQTVDVPAIDTDGVQRAWRRVLSLSGLDTSAADQLAARMRLPEATIDTLHDSAQAAATVAQRHLTVADLHEAVRAHPQHRIEGLAQLLPTSVRLEDLVLSPETRSGIDDILAHARHSAAVTSGWAGSTVRGRAVIALFHGASGTGKTAATEAIAAELDRDLWVVDLAQVVSKWLGETSRNLDRLLTEAARGGAVLLFDEAEGLFGRRGEIADARDRYANLEIDHLLQRVELHEGLVILTSNRPAALDEGFQRRIRVSVRFDLPDHQARHAIWQSLLTSRRLAAGVRLDLFADAELSGASIRAAALSALVFAAADGTSVTEAHLVRAVQSEMGKNGRSWRLR